MRFLKILIPLVLLLCCFSCRTATSNRIHCWMEDNGKIKVLTSIEMINDLVIAIGKEHVDSIALIVGNLDPHSYELVKGDDEKFARADLVVCNGLGLEHGASLMQTINLHKNCLSVGEEIFNKSPEKIIIINKTIDPHIWTDVSLWSESIDFIVERLSKLDPVHAEEFKQNGLLLKKDLLDAHQDILNEMKSISSEKRYLVTSHDAFNYFAKAYLSERSENDWHSRFSAPEGLAPDGQLSSSNIRGIIEHLKKFNIHVLFPESNVSQSSIKKIIHAGNQMGLELIIATEPLYGDAMIVEEGVAGKNYINMMKHNAETIKKYLDL
ncbi:MAG: zinc ABC transporter substrate-binding protein [Chlamydiota bacterium]